MPDFIATCDELLHHVVLTAAITRSLAITFIAIVVPFGDALVVDRRRIALRVDGVTKLVVLLKPRMIQNVFAGDSLVGIATQQRSDDAARLRWQTVGNDVDTARNFRKQWRVFRVVERISVGKENRESFCDREKVDEKAKFERKRDQWSLSARFVHCFVNKEILQIERKSCADSKKKDKEIEASWVDKESESSRVDRLATHSRHRSEQRRKNSLLEQVFLIRIGVDETRKSLKKRWRVLRVLTIFLCAAHLMLANCSTFSFPREMRRRNVKTKRTQSLRPMQQLLFTCRLLAPKFPFPNSSRLLSFAFEALNFFLFEFRLRNHLKF